jgi:hypothetical protein
MSAGRIVQSAKWEKNKMDSLQLVNGMNDAIKLLTLTRCELATGAFRLWQLVSHAEKYLNSQIAELLAAPESEASNGAN